MFGKSTTTFAELRRLLMELGFAEKDRGTSLLYEHVPSKTILAYRPYRARDRVLLVDMHITRQDLDWHDLLRPDEFDQRLNTTGHHDGAGARQ